MQAVQETIAGCHCACRGGLRRWTGFSTRKGDRWYLRADGINVSPAAIEAGPFFEALLAGWERRELQVFRRLDPPASGMWSAGMPAGVLEWRLGDTFTRNPSAYFSSEGKRQITSRPHFPQVHKRELVTTEHG